MAIINNPRKPEEETKKPEGIIKTPSASKPTSQNLPSTSTITQIFAGWGKYVLSIVAIVAVVTAIYYAPSDISFISLPESATPIDNKLVSLEVERMMRIGGLMELIEKKIIQTGISLKKSEKIGDKVLIDTMRLNLARNINDLVQYQQEFVVGLAKLHEWHLQNPKYMAKLFKTLLKSSHDVYKVGRAKTITKIQKLLQAVPAGSTATDFFSKEIKIQG